MKPTREQRDQRHIFRGEIFGLHRADNVSENLPLAAA
jgi:hypothetical protein